MSKHIKACQTCLANCNIRFQWKWHKLWQNPSLLLLETLPACKIGFQVNGIRWFISLWLFLLYCQKVGKTQSPVLYRRESLRKLSSAKGWYTHHPPMFVRSVQSSRFGVLKVLVLGISLLLTRSTQWKKTQNTRSNVTADPSFIMAMASFWR